MALRNAVCRLAELAAPTEVFVGAKGVSVVLLRNDKGRPAAYLNRCPHAGTPLNLFPGKFLDKRGNYILCATHGALFRKDDGLCVHGPCAGRRLSAIDVKVGTDDAGREVVGVDEGQATALEEALSRAAGDAGTADLVSGTRVAREAAQPLQRVQALPVRMAELAVAAQASAQRAPAGARPTPAMRVSPRVDVHGVNAGEGSGGGGGLELNRGLTAFYTPAGLRGATAARDD